MKGAWPDHELSLGIGFFPKRDPRRGAGVSSREEEFPEPREREGAVRVDTRRLTGRQEGKAVLSVGKTIGRHHGGGMAAR